MAELSSSVRQPRAQRHTTSCGECRKRKQRCNQGHPCSNCARRFPQPACEYKENKRRDGFPIPNTSTFLLATLQTRDEGRDPLHSSSRSTISTSEAQSELVALVSWSDVDIQTTFPESQNSSAACGDWEGTRPGVLPDCPSNCTEHSIAFHDAARLLQYTNWTVNEMLVNLGTPAGEDDIDWAQLVISSNTFGGGGVAQAQSSEASQAPPNITTKFKADLLQVYVKLMSRFKCAIDGNPDPNGFYFKTYMPFCFQSPLLVNIAIFSAASYMHETNYIDKTTSIAIKGYTIRMLNDLLRSEHSGTSDEVIAGITHLLSDEWFWGARDDLQAHLRGLRELVRIRGGFNTLGLGGLLSKTAIILDYSIAITFEEAPYLQRDREITFSDPNPGPFRISHNTPLIASMVTFSDCISGLKLHPATASILDDIRFLIATVTSLPQQSTPAELHKVAKTSKWIMNKIANLPAHSPESSGIQTPSQDPTNRSLMDACQATPVDSPASASDDPSDPVYQSIRQAALLYATAIVERRPFSRVCSDEQFYELWATMWRVPQTRWRQLAGIFLWIVALIVPTAAMTPHSRFVKSMLTTPGLEIGIENWFAASSSLRMILTLQAWLRAGNNNSGNASPHDPGQGFGPSSSLTSSVSSSSRQSSGHV